MEENNHKINPHAAVLFDAIKEGKVDGKDILEEITPLLYDYFVGGIKFDGEHILFYLKNSQKFEISIREIK